MIGLLLALFMQDPALHADFAREDPGVRLTHGLQRGKGGLEFATPLQFAEIGFSRKLDGLTAMTAGGWFLPKRSGEQFFLFRGIPHSGPNGERLFPPNDRWVNFMLGTDPRGFLMGAINGNGGMPFPFVTLNEVPINSWSQIVLTKDAGGFQRFYMNGTLVCTDLEAAAAGKIRPFVDQEEGDPVRVSMPLGGTAGEIWVFARELSADEIRKDFEAKKDRYAPALPVKPVLLRDIDSRPSSGLRPFNRARAVLGMAKVFGPMPAERVPLDPKVLSEEDCGTYVRRKVSIQVQADDRMPAYVLIPKSLKGRVPAILCFYGTTSGAGKETTVGLSGPRPGTPPARNRAFAVDMVEAGFVAFAADYLRDGERVRPGKHPYDTTEFYEKFPDWSIHGKDAWDSMRAIDYLQSLDIVDPEKVGMVGHSYGGHSTIFTAAMEPRLKAAWANGPVSDFLQHGMHWASPKGAGSSQSLPGMRPYVLDRTLEVPITFHEVTALIAPRPLCVGQAVGERRPMEEENVAAVSKVYRELGAADRVRYVWYPGDHDFPPHVRREAVEWFRKWLR